MQRLTAVGVLCAGLLLAMVALHAQQTCPCSLWTLTTTPGANSNDASAVELGMKFTSDTAGYVTGVRFYKYAKNTGTHIGNLWSSSGTLLGTVTFSNESASGWQQATFAAPIAIAANTTYVISYFTPTGYYAFTQPGFSSSIDNAPLHGVANSTSANGVFNYASTSGFPATTWQATNYWVDVVFNTTTADTIAPTVTSVTPTSGAQNVPVTTAVTATFSEAMTPSTISTSTIDLRDASNALVPATVTYNASTFTATLTPTVTLVGGSVYTARVHSGSSGVKDLAGNPLAADSAWTFTTVSSTGPTCPCSLWTLTTTPGANSNDASAVELGMKFTSDTAGYVTGVRFYKYAKNTGTHIGNLWSSSGTLLGTVTFSNESASGWQQATFAAPIAIAANTTYVISYFTPTGYYAFTQPGFSSSIDNAPLHGVANSTSANGVFNYASTSGFPAGTWQATNYWVDVVFTSSPVDTTPPTVTTVTPTSGAVNIPTTTAITATFNEALTASTVSTSTIDLRDVNNVLVPATASYNASTFVATLTPTSALASGMIYTAVVHGGSSGVKDVAGNALAADFVWTFTTALPDTTPPTITSITPSNGAAGVSTATAISVSFSEAMTAATISASTMTLRDSTNATVAATVSYNASTFVVTITPSATLANSATYGLTVTGGSGGVKDLAGNALASNVVSSFTTAAAAAGGCPCSLWTSSTMPGVNSNDPSAVEVGMKFTSDVSGQITGVRFYKYSQNTGVHTGSLWTSSGTLLRTVTFSGETSSGWQQANFATPVAIAANTTYVVSYHTATGYYAATRSAFSSPIDNAPLHGLASGTSGGNGVFVYGAGGSFPTTSFQATNYWVDVVLSSPDIAPPTVTMSAPSNGAGVSGTIALTASASDNVGVSSVSFVVDGIPVGGPVSAAPYTVSWNSTTASNGNHAIYAVASDAAGNVGTSTAITVNVSNASSQPPVTLDTSVSGDRSSASSIASVSGVSTTGANELLLAFIGADASSSGSNTTVTGVSGGGLTWTLVKRENTQRGTAEVWRAFATSQLASTTVTATLSRSASSSITVSSFKNVDMSGTNGAAAIGAIASNNGPSGAPSASLTTTRGNSMVVGVGVDWDTATARTMGSGQTMVHEYRATLSGEDFWVQRLTSAVPLNGAVATINDVAPTSDRWNLAIVEIRGPVVNTPPSITSISPPEGATLVSVASVVTATFSEAMNTSTIVSSNVQLRDANNVLVPSSVSYDSSTNTAIITPTASLSRATTYTATVTTGVMDLTGLALPNAVSWSFTTAADPSQDAGVPILLITSSSDPFSSYYAEILRAEGLNEFALADLSAVTSTVLGGYDVVLLAQQFLTASQVTMFTNWVTGGGNLIAMRPDKQLAGLLGLTQTSATLSNGYIQVDTSKAPGKGIESQTMQFHGTADEYNMNGAVTVATLYSTSSISTPSPAVTVASVGTNGGRAAAFTYDLARSVVYTRQGNPAWAAQERDATPPIRPDDLFYGAKAGDIQPDWVDLSKVAIPQADEQQRLLANMILFMNGSKKPLPRFWYFPRGNKAVVIMTGDNHATTAVIDRLNQYLSYSTPGCNVANWECVRASAYIFPQTPVTNAQIASFVAQGFEVGIHLTMDPTGGGGCGSDFTPATLQSTYDVRLGQFMSAFPGAGQPTTHRMHCVMWSDWSTQAQVERSSGIRLDTTYYYWPATWINDTPGMFTGSGMPMRIANLDGSAVDVYEAATQMTDESGQTYPLHIDTLINNALGANGYYGAFTANMHSDVAASSASDAIVASAQSHGVPIVSAGQMLTWLDGRNGSSFSPMSWAGNVLTFSVGTASGANGLQAMIPVITGAGLTLQGVTLNGVSVSYTTQTIKGTSYAFVTVAPGQYKATYH